MNLRTEWLVHCTTVFYTIFSTFPPSLQTWQDHLQTLSHAYRLSTIAREKKNSQSPPSFLVQIVLSLAYEHSARAFNCMHTLRTFFFFRAISVSFALLSILLQAVEDNGSSSKPQSLDTKHTVARVCWLNYKSLPKRHTAHTVCQRDVNCRIEKMMSFNFS